MTGAERECACLRAGPLPGARATRYLGIDPAGGRFAEVEIEECTNCRRPWLHYEIGGEDPGTARWFRGVLPRRLAERVTAATALEVLGSLEWYLQGGAWFGTPGERACGPPDAGR
jgi:hypothetical protein